MSDPRPPQDHPPAPPPERPEHHGLVEEIREEIAEAVEHVPQPVRWTVSRIVWAIALGLVGLLLVAVVSAMLYVANRTEWVAQEIAIVVNQTLVRRSDVLLEMKDVKGNPFTGLVVHEPRVKFRDGDLPPLFEARSMRLRYTFWGLVTGGKGPIVIEAEHPVVRLANDASGHLRIPKWRAEPRKGKPRGLAFVVLLHDAVFRQPGPVGGVEGLELRAEVRTGGPTEFVIKDMRWARGPWGSVLHHLEGGVFASDSIRVRVDRLEASDLALKGLATWKSGDLSRSVHAEVGRVRWQWLAKVFSNDAFAVPGEGRFVVDAAGDRTWKGRFDGTFQWDSLAGAVHGGFDYDGHLWRVDPLTGTSLAGDLSGKMRYAKEGWDLEGDVLRGDPSRWGPIRLTGWPAGNLRGHFRYAQDARHDGTLVAALGASDLAGWRADSARVAVRFLAAGDDSFHVTWLRRGGRARLDGAAGSGAWSGRYAIAGLPLDEWPDGRASGIKGMLSAAEGGVEGRPEGVFVTGDLSGEGSDWLGAHMAGWKLRGVEGRLLPTPDFTARARLADATFLGVHFDSSALALRIGDGVAGLDTVRAWAGDTLLTLGGEARWDRSGWSTSFPWATLRSDQLDWTADAAIALHGDPTGVTFDHLTARDADARIAVEGRWAGPGGRYDWRFRGDGLDLGRLGLPLDWEMGGRGDAALRVTGAYGDPRWEFDGRVRGPAAGGHRGDSLVISLAGAPAQLEVRNLRFGVAGGALQGTARFSDTARLWPDTLTADGVNAWVSGARAWEGQVRSDELPVEGFGSLAPAARGWAGKLDATVRLAGSPARPRVAVEVDARPLSWRGVQLDRAEARAHYEDDQLTVESVTLTRGAVGSTIHGRMPLHLELGGKPTLPEKPMEWRLDLPNGDLALLPLLVPQVGFAAGRFELDAKVAGTPRHPDLDGTLRVRKGTLRMNARDEIVEDVYADLRLDESRITLDSLTARQHPRGRVTARGGVDLDGFALKGYRFDLALRDFTSSDPGLYAAEFDGDFVVTNGRRLYGTTLPHVEGHATVQDARIFIDFANQTESEQLAATTQPLFWTYRVQLEATKNLRWQPPDADIEFNADLTVEQTVDSLLVYGEMHALRGSYFFLSNQFRVLQADLTFDNLKGVDPEISASASTRLTSSGGETAGDTSPRAHTVTVSITGRAREPVVGFSSDPADWDDSRILRELTLGSVLDTRQGSVDLQRPLDSYLTQAINRTLSAELSRTFRGYLNDWQIERERGGLVAGEGGVIVGFSTQPWRNLNFRYRQRVPGAGRTDPAIGSLTNPLERSVEAEYRLSRFFFVTSEFVQRRDATGTQVSGTPDFNVNLKARWEY